MSHIKNTPEFEREMEERFHELVIEHHADYFTHTSGIEGKQVTEVEMEVGDEMVTATGSLTADVSCYQLGGYDCEPLLEYDYETEIETFKILDDGN